MKIGFAQINPTVGDLSGNFEKIVGAYQRLAAAGAELVLTPELAVTGYPPQDLVFKSRFVPENLAILQQLHSRVENAALLVGTKQSFQVSSTLHERLLAEVPAVEIQQIKGIEDDAVRSLSQRGA